MKPNKILRRMANQGNKEYPRATVAHYGPDDRKASKVVLGIFLKEGDEPTIYRFFSQETDVRYRMDIQQNILARAQEHKVRSVVMMDRIIGCPHEEGKDYPLGEACPQCPFWKGRDRFTGIK